MAKRPKVRTPTADEINDIRRHGSLPPRVFSQKEIAELVADGVPRDVIKEFVDAMNRETVATLRAMKQQHEDYVERQEARDHG